MTLAARLERYQVALLAVLPAVWASIVFAPAFFTDPDSYFHVGVARRFLELGWIREFEWLPYTTLADPYPDMYLGQHLVLAPLVAIFGPTTAMRIGVILLASAFAISLHLVLRRRGVRWPAPWVVLGLLACPLALSYAVFLKGASAFLILLPWFVDAVWTGARRRTFVLAWLSVYVYVGATVLVPFAIVHLVVVRWFEERWDAGGVLATLAGLVAGMVANPFWPAQWSYVGAELATVFARDGVLVPGEYRGMEWTILGTDMLVRLAGAALVAWAVVLVRQLRGSATISATAMSGTIAALGLLGGGLMSGTKLVELFVVFSILAIPQITERQRPWPRAVIGSVLVIAVALAAWSVTTLRGNMREATAQARFRDYEAMARWLGERTASDEVIVAPWDDMPGLFMYGGDQRYLAGFNVQFLRDADRQRFNAYALFYRGVITDPEQTLVQFFDGARFVLVRRVPRLPGEPALTASLSASAAFEELASPTPHWRVFRRLSPP